MFSAMLNKNYYGQVYLTIPDLTWVNRLRKGNKIWLVKEQCHASIEQEWEPQNPNYPTGTIILKKIVGNDEDEDIYYLDQETWSMHPDGTGFDRKQLILPIMSNLENNPSPLEEPAVRQLQRAVALLEHRVRILETGLWFADSMQGLVPKTPKPRWP